MSDITFPIEGTDDVTAWMCQRGLEDHQVPELLGIFCDRLVKSGIPLRRAQIGMGVVHPHMRGYAVTWWSDTGIEKLPEFRHDSPADEGWYRSPGHYMLTHRVAEIRKRLDEPATEPDFLLYDDLREMGLTDYYTAVHSFFWDTDADTMTDIKEMGLISSWATDDPDQFTDDDLDRLRHGLVSFALSVKAQLFQNTAESLMQTYLGADAGMRVLHGDVHRGDTQTYDAVIALADLRGFTAMTDTMDMTEVIPTLNKYFQAVCAPIEAAGGQVLKFLGDGVLAVFPTSGDAAQDQATADRALQAARDGLENARDVSRSLRQSNHHAMDLDIALHHGRVMYGNIGSENRLDFTVIGPAVNEAARMEGMCSTLDVHLLMSDAFTALLSDRTQVVDLGSHGLRGVTGERRLYTGQ